MNIPTNFHDLTPQNVDLIGLLKEQVERDLMKIGIQLELSTQHRNWFSELSDILRKLEQTGQLNQFLYTVDLPENWSKEIQSTNDPFQELAEAVLQREWQKVYLRKMYSGR